VKDILRTAVKVLGWLVLLAAFAALGFITDNPSLMVPLYFLFFLTVFALVFLYNLKKSKRRKTNPTQSIVMKKALGILLVVLALLTPYYIFRQVGFTFSIHAMIMVITLIAIILTIIAVVLIKKAKLIEKILGYVLLLFVCSIPALLMIQYDQSYNALGTAYYSALIIAILSWWGIDLYLKAREKQA
jgi:hypothetical protein